MQENKLGTMPMRPLLVSMSLPMMISFFIQALYNIVDSMFVAQISENALTAVSLAFPMQQIANAIAVGIGVGMSALIPRFMGQKEETKANQTAHVGIFLNLLFYLLFLILGLTIVPAFYRMQTNVPEIIDSGIIYLRICWCVSMGVFSGQYFEKMLVCSGNSIYAMIAQASGAIFNIVFDPLLIFGLGPFPELGIAGAAWATVLGQILGALVGVYFNIHKNHWIHFHVKEIKYRHDIAKQIIEVGLPSTITIGLNSATSFCVNMIIMQYSTTATAIYGIWLKLQNFCFMPLFGLNNAMVPILSYNQAQGKIDRVKSANRLAFLFAVGLMVTLACILEIFPAPFLDMFNASDNMRNIGMTALRICCLSLPFGGVCLVRATAMQALNHARYTLILNILRQFVVIVGSFLLLSMVFHQISMLWWAVPITEVFCVILSTHLYHKMIHKLLSQR